MTAPTKTSLWSTAKRIFKPKKNSLLEHHHDRTEDGDFDFLDADAANISGANNVSIVTQNELSSTPSPRRTPSPSTKLALPSLSARSKATVATASTALSTVPSSSPLIKHGDAEGSPSGSPYSTRDPQVSPIDEDSCCNSTQWTSSSKNQPPRSNPVPCMPLDPTAGPSNGDIQGGNSQETSPTTTGSRKAVRYQDNVPDGEEENVMDGFVQLITERQRSRFVSLLFLMLSLCLFV